MNHDKKNCGMSQSVIQKFLVRVNQVKQVTVKCTQCGKKGMVVFASHEVSLDEKNLVELDFYPVIEPFAYIKILKDTTSLDKFYKVIEPQLSDGEHTSLILFRIP